MTQPTIVLADADSLRRASNEQALRIAGFTVIGVQDGQEAHRRIMEDHPPLALIESRLPDTDSVDLCRRIKAEPETAATLILLLSASPSKAKASQADGWLSPSATSDELVSHSRLMVRLSRAEQHCARLQRERAAQSGHLKQAQQQLENFFKLSPDLMAVAGLDGYLKHVSSSWQHTLGYSLKDLLAHPWLQFVHPDDHAQTLEAHQQLHLGRTARVFLNRCRHQDGSYRWLDWRCIPVPERELIYCVARDITEAKQAEQALRDSEERYRSLVELSPDAILLSRSDRIEFANSAAVRLCGVRSTDEILGKSPVDLFPPEYRPIILEHITNLQQGTCTPGTEVHLVQWDGTTRNVEVAACSFRDRDGTAIQVILHDMTKRKRVEQALRDSERLYRAIGESIDYGVWVCTPDGRNIYASDSFLELVGLTQEQCSSFGWGTVLHPDDAEQTIAAWKECVRSGGVWDREHRFRGLDGQWHDVLARGVPVRNERGEVICWAGINLDISRLKRAEQALRASEHFKQGVLDSLPAHVAVLDAGGRIQAVNQPWLRFARENGDPAAHRVAIGANYLDVCRRASQVGDRVAGDVLHGIAAVLHGDRTQFELEYPCNSPDRVRWFVLHVLRPPADVGGAIVTHMDITARKLAEEALRNAQDDLSRAQAVAHTGSWRLDVRRNQLLWSDENHRIFGIATGTPLTYETFLELVHPDDRAYVDQQWMGALRGEPYDIEHRIVVGHEVKWVRERAELEFDREGLLRGGFGTTQDITSRKRMEEALRASEERFRLFMDNSPTIAWIKDERGCHVYLSRTYENRFGVRLDDWRGKTDFELWPREVAEQFWTNDRAVLAAARAMEVIEETVNPDGGRSYWRNFKFPLQDAAGNRYVAGIGMDITASRQAEQALRESEARYRTLVENAPMAIFVNRQDRISLVNRACLRLFGASSPEQLLGRSPYQLFHPDFHPLIRERIRQIREHGEVASLLEERIVRLDGSVLDVEVAAAPFRDQTASAIHVMLYDITERKRAEAALRESERRFRQLSESLPQLVWTCTPDGACDYLGPQWVEYTGIPDAPQLAFAWLEQIHPDDRDGVKRAWQAAVEHGSLFDIEFRIRRSDGTYRWFQTRATPLRDEQGKVLKWFGTNTDIEALKQAEQALREADRRKDEFLAMLAHELRNPLAPIRNAVAILRSLSPPEPALQRARDLIDRQVGHLTHLIDDLLDVSRITRGKISLEIGTVDLASVVEHAVDASRSLIEARRHELTVSLPLDSGKVRGDFVRLVQIVSNLLSNAAKFTDAGGHIWLTVEALEDAVILRVRDNGIGIPRELLPEIFEVFTQGQRTLDRAQGGLGIGLSLVKRLVEMHGGAVEARSDGLNQGSEFVVRLPRLEEAATAASLPAEPPMASPSGGLRILVVDDNTDAADSLSVVLSLEGHQVQTVYDGAAAIRAARDLRPQAVLLDIGLPGMDGFEVARRLRAMPETRDCILVAMTGYGEPESIRRSRESGFHHHLVKPVDLTTLTTLLSSVPVR